MKSLGIKFSDKIKVKEHLSAYGLMLFFLMMPFEYPLTTFGVGSILKYIGIFTMMLAVVDFARDKCMFYFDYRIVLWVFWLVYTFTSAVWCVDEENFNRMYSIYLNNALMFLVVTIVRYNKEETLSIKRAYITGVMLLLMYMTFVPGAVTYSWDNRLTLGYGGAEIIDPNYIIAVISVPFGFVVSDLIDKKEKIIIKLLRCLYCGTCFIYAFLTGSRSGLISLVIISIMCMLSMIKKHIILVIMIVIAVCMILPTVVEYLPEDVMNRFTADSMTGNTEDSGSRLEIWKYGFEAIKDGNLLLGYGVGSSLEVMRTYRGKSKGLHNHFIASLLETGIIGVLLSTVVIVVMVIELLKQKQGKFCIAFIGILAVSMFLDVLHTKFFWGAMILMSIFITSERRKEIEN